MTAELVIIQLGRLSIQTEENTGQWVRRLRLCLCVLALAQLIQL